MTESLVDELGALALKPRKRLIIVDALNYLNDFAPIDDAAACGVNANAERMRCSHSDARCPRRLR